jgi:transposase, IS5 family
MMKQRTLAIAMATDQGFEQYHKPAWRDQFPETMNCIVPWAMLCAALEPHYPKRFNGRPPIGLECMLRIHFQQHWWT